MEDQPSPADQQLLEPDVRKAARASRKAAPVAAQIPDAHRSAVPVAVRDRVGAVKIRVAVVAPQIAALRAVHREEVIPEHFLPGVSGRLSIS